MLYISLSSVILFAEMGIGFNPWFLLPLVILYLCFKACLSTRADRILPGQSLSGNQTITSLGGIFELGFFTPGNSQNYYIGIWYRTIRDQTVVWLANRDKPVSEPSSSALILLEDGNLVLLDPSKVLIWYTNSASGASVTMLLDSGNLVLKDGLSSSSIIWQSFDYPTNALLPGGKLGFNKLTNKQYSLTSWRNVEDPAPGLFSAAVEPKGTSHILQWNRSITYGNSGNWTGYIFTSIPEIAINYYITNVTIVSNEKESYFTYSAASASSLTRFVVDVNGQSKQWVWEADFASNEWSLFWTGPQQQCIVYAYCGPYGICNQLIMPLCGCVEGFEPRSLKDWNLDDHSGGCVRKGPLQCNNGGKDTFLLISNMKWPEKTESPVGDVKECELACLRNCSCTAYAYDEGCLMWQGDLLNLEKLSQDDIRGRNLYVRVGSRDKKTRRITAAVIMGAVAGVITLFAVVLFIIWRCWKIKSPDVLKEVEDNLVVFTYKDLKRATKNFSEKLGQGGFGSVFKGTLPNSNAIAVKRLNSVKQGDKQFRSEVNTIGIIQHINLVRLRGFCEEGKRRFLVYELMPNGSLESQLFRTDPVLLDWKTRYEIALGIARGLTYLHEKCRDCIIQCDIKPENILLDAGFQPKIADFGLAKILGRDFSRMLTTMKGTRGYLAPEWLSGIAITPKVDVFSYGMVLFEVISGRRNWDLLDDDMDDYFPNQVANKLNKGEELLTLLDHDIKGSANTEELTRACRIACWCIQDDEKNRPSMGQVVQILEGVSETGMPPVPKFLQEFTRKPSRRSIAWFAASTASKANSTTSSTRSMS